MLRWVDGFEHYGAVAHMLEGVGGGAAWSQIDDGPTFGWALSTANPATGAYHLRLTSFDTDLRFIRRIFGVAKQVVGNGYRFALAELPETEGILTQCAVILADVRDASNNSHITIVVGTDGSVFALRGASVVNHTLGGTLLGPRSDPCIAAGGYHHFEYKAKIDNSVGYLEVRINQVTVLNLTGIDTQNTANASAAQVVVGQSGSSGAAPANFGTWDIDDFTAWDDDNTDAENTVVDFLGDKGVYYLPPNADTATSDFDITGSVTAYGALDEIPPTGAEYLDTEDTTARTIVGVASLPANVSEVIAFMPVGYMRKDESGPVTMRLGVVSGVDEAYGPDDDPSTEYAYLRPGPKTIDPETGVAWASDAAPKLLIERTA